MYHVFHCLAKKTDYRTQKKQKKGKCITTPILKPIYDQKPETFFGLTVGKGLISFPGMIISS